MGKRPLHDDDNEMELRALKSEMTLLSKRVEEVITILGGNSSYGLSGMKSDVKDLKTDVQNIKAEIREMKMDDKERDRKSAFFSVKLETIPQKIVGVVAFIIMVLTIVQSLRTLFTPIAE